MHVYLAVHWCVTLGQSWTGAGLVRGMHILPEQVHVNHFMYIQHPCPSKLTICSNCIFAGDHTQLSQVFLSKDVNSNGRK